MESLVNAIDRLIRAISDMMKRQTDLLVKHLGPLRELPRIVGEVREDMVRGFSTVAKSQIMIALAEHKGRYQALNDLMEEETSEIANVRERVTSGADAIREGAMERIRDLDSDLQKNIDQMDGALLDLGRSLFPTAVYDAHADEVVPGWQLHVRTMIGSSQSRNHILNDDTQRFAQRLAMYEKHCEALQEQAKSLAGPKSQGTPKDLLIPVCFVEYDKAYGKKNLDVIVAPRTSSSGSTVESALPWLTTLMEKGLEQHRQYLFQQAKRLPLLDSTEASDDIDNALLARLVGDE